MSAFLLTLHIIASLILIGGILLQPGAKGGGLGAAFGGGGANTAFGARGAAPFLAKMTYWLAGCFLVTSLLIEIHIVKENRSVLEKKVGAQPVQGAPAPQMPAPAQK